MDPLGEVWVRRKAECSTIATLLLYKLRLLTAAISRIVANATFQIRDSTMFLHLQ